MNAMIIKKTRFQLFIFFLLSLSAVLAQNFTLEDIWIKNTFEMKAIDGYQWAKKKGTIYIIEENQLVLFDYIKIKKRLLYVTSKTGNGTIKS